MAWKQLGGGGGGGGPVSTSTLPGNRGSYLLCLEEPIVPDGPKWVHFSWLGESFCIRDFLAGRERREEPGLTATDVWRAARRHLAARGQYRVPVTSVDQWRELLEQLSEDDPCS